MFNKKETGCSDSSSSKKVFHEKPKILTIDLPEIAYESIKDEGYNIVNGSFGKPYKVEIGSGFSPVITKATLPNYSEQEILIINLTAPDATDYPEGEKKFADSEPSVWSKCNRGVIDPRPHVMLMVQNDFDRILYHGGLIVIFSQSRMIQDFVWGKIEFNRLDIEREIHMDNWSFSSMFSKENIEIEYNAGEEIHVNDYDLNLIKFLKTYIKKTKYTTTFKPTYRIDDYWIPILFDKYERTIAAIIKPDDTKGRILILPQIEISKPMILSLIKEVFPEISPHLFPHIEGAKWVEREEYELIQIIDLKKEIAKIQKKTQQDIESIENKISIEREKNAYLHNILSQSGDELVESIIVALQIIGFKRILNVDKEISSLNINKQEDLQIHDTSPTLLIEIKGLTSLPHEAHTLQVIKYVSRRMKEWSRVDVRGVSIINHQRNLPALERDNINVFTDQQIEDAIENDITIISTWDLFLLIKGMMRWNWNHESIKSLFYKKGKIDRVPPFYFKLGIITNYYDRINVVSVTITDNELRKGDKIAYILPTDYFEEIVETIEIDKQSSETAKIGSVAGIKTVYSKDILRKGILVYIVRI